MPIYEYRCQTCGHNLELLQGINEPPAQDCPECGKPSLQKLISAAGFQLKGSGWYVTDFKNIDKKSTAKTTTEKASTDTKADTGTTENKAKTDTAASKKDE